MSTRHGITARVKADGLIAIVRGDFAVERTLAIADTVRDAGVSILEVTLNTTGALEAIAALRLRQGERMLIGAGTVRGLAQWRAAVEAGAQFSVAPSFHPEVVAAALAADFLHLPGVFTPTEVERAVGAGCRVVKLFPVDALGPAYLKALRAPLDDVDFVPTGGIGVDNIASYRKAGAVAVGIGGSLVAGPSQSLDDLAARARALRAAWEGGARG